nr:hypothetical protein HmN_000677800 [Hymenolepis microstoma]
MHPLIDKADGGLKDSPWQFLFPRCRKSALFLLSRFVSFYPAYCPICLHPVEQRGLNNVLHHHQPPHQAFSVHQMAVQRLKAFQSSSLQQQPPLSNSPILFFQFNAKDLGICLPTNILQLGPQSMELDSRTAIVLTREQRRNTICLRGPLVSEGEFTEFCLRFDDDFNVGSDDWKPDKARSTVAMKKENHLVVMNGCVVPSGTFQMRGLDVHLDDNIGRRLNDLFEVLTTVTSSETDLHPTSTGAMAAGSEAQDEDELR